MTSFLNLSSDFWLNYKFFLTYVLFLEKLCYNELNKKLRFNLQTDFKIQYYNCFLSRIFCKFLNKTECATVKNTEPAHCKRNLFALLSYNICCIQAIQKAV